MKSVLFTVLVSLVLVGCGPHIHRHGVPGTPGAPGEDGKNSLINTLRFEAGLQLCESDSGVEIQSGLDLNDNLVLDSEEIQQATIVCDGKDGQDGQDGEDAPIPQFTVVDSVNPCGQQGTYDEVLLKLQNGEYLAHYAHGNKQFLTIIGDGNYVTTDGTSCNFSIVNGVVSW